MSSTTPQSRRPGRSAVAILSGFVAVVVLSIGTDVLLHAAGVYPPMDQPRLFTTPLLLIATGYRVAYSVLGGYIAAGLAPNRPAGHAVVLGLIGLAVSAAGAIAMRDVSPAWYPLALVITALPSCWLGGVLFLRRRGGHTALR
jgi:hypothetical protein